MGLGPSDKMSLIRQRHQPPREALQQNGEKEAGHRLTQGPKGPTPRQFSTIEDMKGSRRWPQEGQGKCRCLCTELCSVIVGYIVQYVIVFPLEILCANFH